jgi:flagellar hook-associated protein 2
VVATASGGAQPGSFDVNVTQLAAAYKAYSDPLDITQSNQALGQSGQLSFTVNGNTASIDVQAGDTLDNVISKVNSSGLRVSATSFFDGTKFRMQLRGLDSGQENDVVVGENGTTFGFDNNVKSNGQDAKLEIDGFPVTSKTNQVQGAIGGVTLALTEVTTTPTTVTVESDTDGFQKKLQSLVDTYNAVVNRIHSDAGFGSIKATNSELSGDTALRGITSRMSSALTQQVGSGKFQTLRSIGIELNNNGTLKLNSTTLEKALAEDPEAVTKVLAGDDGTTKGLADSLVTVATDLLSAKGLVQTRKDGLGARQKQLTDRADIEQKRLDRMEEMLRKQFTEMDSTVAATKAQANFL